MAISGDFSKAEIAEQLNRILSAAAFKNSRVLSGFLEFVVDKTLDGKEQEIKEYTIGIDVLSRHSDFNPQLDTIVRTHAGRLRRALKEYYYESGKDDPILFEIPKGSYIPVFLSKGNAFQAETNEIIDLERKKPVVAVLPFRNISSNHSRDFFADGLGEQLSTDLTRFHDLSVISYYSTRHITGKTSDIKEAANLLGASYVLTGSVQSDAKHLRISTQLILADTGTQLWAKSFEEKNSATGLFEIQNEIIKGILTEVGGYYGAIFRDVLKAPLNSESKGSNTYDAIFWYYHYQMVFTKDVLEKAIIALEAAVKADPHFALAWAMLGELYLDDKVMEFKKIDNPLEEGLKCCMRAIALDPTCQHAYMSLAWVNLFHHNREEILKAVDQCVVINPNAADVLGALGFVLVCAGEFERGSEFLRDSLKHNPFCPWWYLVGFVFYFLSKKDYPQALHWIGKVSRPDLYWDPMMKACVLGHLNRPDEAQKNLDLFIQLVPDADTQAKVIIEAFILSPDLNNEILEGLKKAGLPVSQQVAELEVNN